MFPGLFLVGFHVPVLSQVHTRSDSVNPVTYVFGLNCRVDSVFLTSRCLQTLIHVFQVPYLSVSIYSNPSVSGALLVGFTDLWSLCFRLLTSRFLWPLIDAFQVPYRSKSTNSDPCASGSLPVGFNKLRSMCFRSLASRIQCALVHCVSGSLPVGFFVLWSMCFGSLTTRIPWTQIHVFQVLYQLDSFYSDPCVPGFLPVGFSRLRTVEHRFLLTRPYFLSPDILPS